MKRVFSYLITSLFVLAFALGAVGCSGDLMDMDPKVPLYICGPFQQTDFVKYDGEHPITDIGDAGKAHRCAFHVIDQNTQELKFTYHGNCSWGAAGNLNFKINTDENSSVWTMDWGAKKNNTLIIPINGEDWTELQGRGAGGEDNPGHAVIENLVEGRDYTLTLKYDAPSKNLKIKVKGTKVDFPDLRLQEVDANGKDVGDPVALKRDGTVYYYILSAADAARRSGTTMNYYLTNGYIYYDNTAADGEGRTSAVVTKPTTGSFRTFKFAKDGLDYRIKLETQYDKDDKVIISDNLEICDDSIFAKAAIIGLNGDWTPHPLTVVKPGEEYTYTFTNNGGETTFIIQQVSGKWDQRWFGGKDKDDDKGKKTDIANDIVAAKYNATATPQKVIYYGVDAGTENNHDLKITGMPYVFTADGGISYTGKQHKITIKCKGGVNDVTVECVCLESGVTDAQYVKPFSHQATGAKYLVGSADSMGVSGVTLNWGSKRTASGDSDSTNFPNGTEYYEATWTLASGATVNKWNTDYLEFAVASDASWTNRWKTNAPEAKSEGNFIRLYREDGDDNRFIEDIPVGTTTKAYTFTFRSTREAIFVKIQ